ncbi:TRAP transporter substrate-binding protein [Rhodobacter sp. NTK016B]|uniref:TRAP transporter substrate-binding protein n=1 Tax=Rhodobacter sp. NTK016B TaxID=2759676 RepID=UPI0039C94761
MFTKTNALSLLATLALSTTVAGSAMAQEVTLRLHQFLPPQANVPALVLDVWADRIEEESEGRIEIERFPAMALGGTPPELMDQVLDGITDLAWTVNGFTPGRFPRSEVFELPFFVQDARAASAAYWQMFEEHMADTDYQDVHLIGTWVHGPGVLHTNTPVEQISDMQGLKLRTPSRMVGQLLEILGAEPIGMPVTAIPESLSRGVIDGAVIPWEVTEALRVPELVENHTEFENSYPYTVTFTLAMNREVYEDMPEDLRAIIDANSGLEFSVFAGGTQADSDIPARQLAVDRGNNIITIPEADVAEWRAAAQPVYEAWIADMESQGIDGQALIDEARELMDAYQPAE